MTTEPGTLPNIGTLYDAQYFEKHLGERDSGMFTVDRSGAPPEERHGEVGAVEQANRAVVDLQRAQDQPGRRDRPGGENPYMSFYSNYIVFDTPSSLDRGSGDRQVFMRYVGGK